MKKWLAIILILFPYMVHAATYYADGNLVSDCTSSNYSIASRNCTGSDGNAYNTIQEAVTAAGASNTISVRSGTYAEDVTTSGASQTITGYDSSSTILIQSLTINHANVAVSSVKFNGTGTHITVNSSGASITSCLFTGTAFNSDIIKLEDGADSFSLTSSTIDGTVTTAKYGTHTGTNNAATLTDTDQSWGTDTLVGQIIYNTHDVSKCTITANTATTVTCTLACIYASCDADWDTDEAYVIGSISANRVVIGTNLTDNVTIENNTIKNMADVERVFEPRGTGWTIKGNTIDNIIQVGGVGGPHVDVFQIFNTSTVDFAISNTMLIENNIITNIGGQLGMLTADGSPYIYGWTFRNNIFAETTGNWYVNIPTAKFWNNVFYKTFTGQSAIYPDADVSFVLGTDSKVYECFDTYTPTDGTTRPITGDDWALYWREDTGSPTHETQAWDQTGATTYRAAGICDGCEFINNFFVGCGHPDYEDNRGWHSWTEPNGISAVNTVDRNNYITKLPASAYAAKSGFSQGTDNINGGDPKFVTVGTNFRLQSDSPAKDGGYTISAWTSPEDKLGVARPQGAGWDIGAYEFSKIVAGGGTLYVRITGTVTIGS